MEAKDVIALVAMSLTTIMSLATLGWNVWNTKSQRKVDEGRELRKLQQELYARVLTNVTNDRHTLEQLCLAQDRTKVAAAREGRQDVRNTWSQLHSELSIIGSREVADQAVAFQEQAFVVVKAWADSYDSGKHWTGHYLRDHPESQKLGDIRKALEAAMRRDVKPNAGNGELEQRLSPEQN